MKRNLLLAITLLISHLTFSQDFEWARQAYHAKESDGKGVVACGKYVYMIGDFTDTLNFGSTQITANNTDSKSGFVAKYDTLGNHIWTVPLKGNVNLKEVTTDGIAMDDNANIYVTGKFVAGFTVGGLIASEPNNKKAFYIFKMDTTGAVQWLDYRAGSATVELEGKRLNTDSDGNIYVCGKIKGGGASFGAYTLAYSTTTTGEAGFVAKYNSSGNIVWAKTLSNTTNGKSGVEDIEIDENGYLYVSGKFDDVATIGDGTTQTVTPSGAENFFIAKMTDAGAVVWIKSAGLNSGTNKNNAKSLVLGNDGSIYVIGDFDNAMSFDDSGNFDYVNTGKNSWVGKWSNSGTLIWVKVHLSGALSTDEFKADGVVVDPAGDLLVIGKFTSTVQISPLPPMTATGGKNTFLVKYNTSGTPQWVKTITGTLDIEGKRLVLDETGKAVICGSIKSDANFYGTLGTLTHEGTPAMKNMFIARHASGMFVPVCEKPTGLSSSNVTQTTADLTWTSTGASNYIINYEVAGSGTWVTENSTTNSVNIDNLLPDTQYNFTVQGECDDIVDPSLVSDVQSFTTATSGIEELNAVLVQLYPNPSNGEFEVNITDNTSDNYLISITDLAGRKIYSQTLTQGTNAVSLGNQSNGTYFYSIESNGSKIKSGKISIN